MAELSFEAGINLDKLREDGTAAVQIVNDTAKSLAEQAEKAGEAIAEGVGNGMKKASEAIAEQNGELEKTAESEKYLTDTLKDLVVKQIELAQAFQTADESSEEWTDEMDNLSRELLTVTDQIGELKTRLKEKTTNSVAQAQIDQLNMLRIKQAALSEEYERLSKTTDVWNEDLEKCANQLLNVTAKIDNLEKREKELEKNGEGIFDGYLDSIKDSITGNSKFGQSIQQLAQSEKGISGVFDGLKVGVQSFGKALLGLMANPVFLAVAGITGAGAAFKWWWDYNKGIEQATRLTQQFTGQEGEKLKQTRSSVQAIADSFDKDFDEVLIATNALAKQMNINFDEALKTVKTGFIVGADVNGEFLETLKEYPAYFKEAGLNAAQFVSIATKGVKDGVFSDKAVDTIKEANLRLREMPKATEQAINGIGLSADEMKEALRKGTATTFDMIQKISRKMKELPRSASEVGTAIADIFGGPGEDAGLQFILDLAEIETSLDEISGQMSDLGVLQNQLVDSNIELENKIAEAFDDTGGFFETIKTNIKILINDLLIKLLNYFIQFKNYVIEIWNENEGLRKSVGFLATLWVNMFSTGLKGAKALGVTLWNLAKLANPVNWFKPSEMKKSFTNIKDALTDYGKSFVNSWVDAFETGTEKFNKKIENKKSNNEQAKKSNTTVNTEHIPTEDELKALKDVQKKRIKMQEDLQTVQIALMEEGLKKKLAQIELEKKKQLDAIDNEQKELETKIKEAGGGGLSKSDKDNFSERRKNAELKAQKEILEAQKENKKAVEELDNSLTAKFLTSEVQKQNAIKETYKKQREELEKMLKGGNIDDFQFLDMLQKIDASENFDLLDSLEQQYKQYADKTLQIEKWRLEEIKKIDETEGLTKTEREQKKADVERIAKVNLEQAEISEEIPEAFAENVNQILQNVLSLSLEELTAKLKEAQIKLKDTKLQVNANPEKVKQLTATISALGVAIDINTQKVQKGGKTAEEKLKDWQDFEEGIRKCIGSIKDMSAALSDVLSDSTTKVIDDVVQISELTLSMIGNIKDFTTTAIQGTKTAAQTGAEAVKTVEKASVILAIISAAVQIAMKIANMFSAKRNEKANKKIEQAQEKIDALTESYNNLDKSIENAYGNSAVEMIKEQDTLLRQQKVLIQQQIAAEKSKKSKKQDSGQIKEWENQIKEIDKTLAGRKETIVEALIGKDYKSVLQDFSGEIMSAMDDAETSVADATKNIAKSIKKAAIQTRLNEILKKDAEKYSDTLAEAMKDGFLNDFEKKNLANIEQTIASTSEQYLNQFDDLWEKAEQEREAVHGGITNMSQDTAEEMNGRLTQMQSHTFSINETTKELRDFSSRQLLVLQGIHDDTSVLVSTTNSIKATLEDITIRGVKLK